MVAINAAVELNIDGIWTPGVVVGESPHRLVIAIGGDLSHRAYIERSAATWRTLLDSGPRRKYKRTPEQLAKRRLRERRQ